MIKEPKKEGPTRKLIETIAQAFSLTAFAASFYRVTHPSAAEKDHVRWGDEVTEQLNEQIRRGTLLESQILDLSKTRVIAHGFVNFASGKLAIEHAKGISSVTDHGIGKLAVNFAEPVKKHYFVSIELPEGQAHVSEKKPNGFSLNTGFGPEGRDISFGFLVVGTEL
ncbi:hypothetical protein EEB11_00215 [Pseudotabrizicola sediminis]|uniref:Uncharacterized protein n=1 Tax=Pseudotabrizicola sediminis TaxID=2486418 RepID=A0ABY2KQM5_9RHOB|nr:hypothetical protein [Pseudotabrizicola sediminis]TGD45048.1 hypothetical protein EEB11_00215 [Pseudotabrizicola sediminis]